MKNVITCKNCNDENPYFSFICGNCKAYLRERVVNIDLWKTIGELVESPVKAFSQIIHAEHKNFIFFFLIFSAIKFFIDSIYISLSSIQPEPELGNFLRNYLIVLAGISLLTFTSGIILRLINSLLGVKTRILDNFAILIYSFVPQVFALILLFTVEATVFGGNLFSKNPSPFNLKEFLAYTLSGFEILIILWGIYLSIMALYTQSKNKIYSIIAGLAFNLTVYFFLYIVSLSCYN